MFTNNHSDGFILFVLSIAQFFGLSLWFAPNAVFDQLAPTFDLNDSDLSLISIAVIAGFIIGSLLSAVSNLPDIMRSQFLFFLASVLGGSFNLLIIFSTNFTMIWFLRFLTGISLAGIYPVGMKLTASHFKENRGFAIGVLLSALTAGSGLPYLFNLFGEPDWSHVLLTVSILSYICGVMVITFIDEGPHISVGSSFNPGAIRVIYRSRGVRLSNYGYFGHMWELYAFWVWIPIFLKDAYSNRYPNSSDIEVLQFFSIGSFVIFFTGALANIVGGYFSDRFGRAKFNLLMLSISGTSGLLIGFFYTVPYMALIIAIIWGTTIIPDSPQYSTLVSEYSDQTLVGTALTIQTAIGFSITMITVRLIPILVATVSWTYAFMFLSLGPLVGLYAMYELTRG